MVDGMADGAGSMRKRRRGFPSEMRVERGVRGVAVDLGQGKAGFKEFVEKLGREDLCPCGSGKRFQAVLPRVGAVLMA
jgi:hypothetical protein